MSGAGTPAPAPASQATQPPQTQFWQKPFIYEMDFAALVNGTTQNGNIQIQADCDFMWTAGAYFADLAGAVQTDSTQVIPLVTVQMVDSATNSNLFLNPVQVSSFFGSGKLPFILPAPYIFKARSNIAFTVVNYSAATTYTNLRLSLIGTKLYYGAR